MGILEKLHTVIMIAAIAIGLFLGQFEQIAMYSEHLIVPFLLLILYGLFLDIPMDEMGTAFRNVRFTGTSLVMNFLWTPALAWILGSIFLYDYPALWIGFIMLMVTPCTDWYLVFTKIAKGNVTLSTAILPINLILQVILLPLYLLIFTGVMKTVSMSFLLESIIIVIVVPFFLALLTLYIMQRLDKQKFFKDNYVPFFAKGQILFLSVAILAMFASQGKLLVDRVDILWLLMIPALFSVDGLAEL
nr:hypothetical protein [Desulfuribacillus stibiiarsenatis]